jgi:hypothetical protein
MSILAIAALSVGVGVGAPVVSNDIEYNHPMSMQLEYNAENGFTAWGAWEVGDLKGGETTVDVDVYELGVGYKWNFSKSFYALGGVGYAWADADIEKFGPTPYNAPTLRELDGGVVGRIGGGVDLGKRWSVNLFYNYYEPSAKVFEVNLDDVTINVNNSLDMSTVKATLMFNF